jgi:hypothetical protein
MLGDLSRMDIVLAGHSVDGAIALERRQNNLGLELGRVYLRLDTYCSPLSGPRIYLNDPSGKRGPLQLIRMERNPRSCRSLAALEIGSIPDQSGEPASVPTWRRPYWLPGHHVATQGGPR